MKNFPWRQPVLNKSTKRPKRISPLHEVLQMKPETIDRLQNGFLVLAAGIIIPPAIGFGFGFWMTKDSAEHMVRQAVLADEAKICVARFTRTPDYQQRLKEYEALDYSAKRAFFEKGNWAKMPGEEKARDEVTDACASRLEALAQK